MTENTPQHNPGDIANGHVLTHDAGWQPLSPPADEKKATKKAVWGRWYMIVAYVIVGLIALGAATGADDASAEDQTKPAAAAASANEKAAAPAPAEKPAPAPEPEEPAAPQAVAVDAGTILNEFEGNEAAADAKYQGKDIRVTGVVDKVDTEFLDDEQYTIQLSNGQRWAFLTVNCNDMSGTQAAKAAVGSTITVTGTFDDGGDLGVEVKDCTLV
jgi:septal ring-binding cell division protein DamX